MKKIIPLFLILIALVSCSSKKVETIRTNADGSVSVLFPDLNDAIVTGKKVDGYSNVTVISGNKVPQNLAAININEYAGRMTTYSLSCSMKVVNSTGNDFKASWSINDVDRGLPTFFEKRVNSGEWFDVSGEVSLVASDNRSVVFNCVGASKPNLTVYIKDFELKIITEEQLTGIARVDWLEAESIKDKYKDIFEYFGFAIGYNGELNTAEVQEGLSRHASCMTMGNEFKPDFIFNWRVPNQFTDFVAEDGRTYKVPDNSPHYGNLDMILYIAQDMGIDMRGHVLVWHNQTPEWFFKENFSTDQNAAFASKEDMNARLEWYIKTLLGHINEWEEMYNDGNRIVKYWDVVNEAVLDNATPNRWVREESNWFKVYQSEEFIINAFRYANKYAPADVKLVYNDYNCYARNKRDGICKLVDEILACPDARIDAVGMQSHVKVDYPAITGPGSFEETVQTFAAKGIDVQITELDIANGKTKYSPMLLKGVYKDYFEMFIRNRKTDEKNGIMGVTIWGLSDAGTWLDNQPEYKGFKQYPLLLNEDFTCKPAFYGVLEAADSLGN